MRLDPIEMFLSAFATTFRRAFIMILVMVLGSQGGCVSHTVPLYHTHAHIWDIIIQGFWFYVLALPIVVVIAIKAESRVWLLLAFAGALILTFLIGWVTACACACL
jgi:hypothetical protein